MNRILIGLLFFALVHTPANATQVFLTSGITYTIPMDWSSCSNSIEAIGGGQAGRTVNGNGGRGGGYASITNEAHSSGDSITIAIGAGGIGATTGAGTWPIGGDTTWAATVLAAGGQVSPTTQVGTTLRNGGSYGAGGGFDAGAGGGGAAGANGDGGAGGASSGGGSLINVGGAGGGGANGGANGVNAPSSSANPTGSAGGSGAASGGAGGAGGDGTTGTAGSTGVSGTNFDGSHGSGGGGGGGGYVTGTLGGNGGSGGLYGGGGGSVTQEGVAQVTGSGSQGLIIVTYTPGTCSSSRNFRGLLSVGR